MKEITFLFISLLLFPYLRTLVHFLLLFQVHTNLQDIDEKLINSNGKREQMTGLKPEP